MRISSLSNPYQSHLRSGVQNAQKTNIGRAWLLAVPLYLIFLIFYALASSLSEGAPALAILHIGSALSLMTFWTCVRWGKGRYDTFGAALLLIYAFFKFHAAIDYWFYGARIEDIYHTVPLPQDLNTLFAKSETLNHFGVLLVVSVWRHTIGSRIEKFSFINSHFNVPTSFAMSVYVVGITLAVAAEVGRVNFGALGQITAILYKLAVISIFFVASKQKSRFQQVFIALALAVPAVLVALGSGMKSEMMFPLIPAVLIVWFRYRSKLFKLLLVVFAFVILAYSQLYVHYVRDVSWGPNAKQYSTIQLVDGFQRHLDGLTFSDGLDSISSRVNMTISRAITVAIADARGFEPTNIFGPIPASLIPRMFWPGKPVMAPGAQHTLRIHNLNLPESEAWSATAAGIFSEMYLGGGYLGWFLGIVIYAYLLANMQLFTLRRMPGYGHLTLSVLTVYIALRFEEEHVVYAYTGLVFTLIVLFGVVNGTQLLIGRRSRSAFQTK